MKIPRILRDQLKFYEGKGFHVTSIEPRSGSHFMITFSEFPQAQIITKSTSDPRAWHNNIAQYRRLQRANAEEKTNG
jgi:hypothetical protein